MANPSDQSEQINFAALEMNVFSAVADCHLKLVAMLREASLDEEQQKLLENSNM